MVRGIIVAVVLATFGAVMVGCHAQGSVGPNQDTSSMPIAH